MKNSNLVVPSHLHAEFSRRKFLGGAAVGTTGFGAALLFGCGGKSDRPLALPAAGEEPPPEVTTLKLHRSYDLCAAPSFLAKPFLFEEGFTDVQYLPLAKLSQINDSVATGKVDICMNFAAALVAGFDAGTKLVGLAGLHVGCYEVVAREGIDSIRELEGKTIAISQSLPDAGDYAFIASLLQFVGAPTDPSLKAFPPNAMSSVLQSGQADAIVALPPLSQQLRTLNVGQVILNSVTDHPWSNYVCCVVATRPNFIQKNPVATKRALRAILRGADLCATKPEEAARQLVEGGFATNYAYALETVSMGKYGIWRDYDPEEALRFYALRLKEAGGISSTPEQIIDGYTDWRFLEMLKDEMAYFPQPAKDRTAFAISCGPDGVPYGPLQQS